MCFEPRFICEADSSLFSQEEIVLATGRTELAWNERFVWVHFGEDGPGLAVDTTRTMFISDQGADSPVDMQDWRKEEVYAVWYDLTEE